MLSLGIEGRGPAHGGEQARIAEIAGVLRQTLRRCDVIARVEQNALAVILVGERSGGGTPRSAPRRPPGRTRPGRRS